MHSFPLSLYLSHLISSHLKTRLLALSLIQPHHFDFNPALVQLYTRNQFYNIKQRRKKPNNVYLVKFSKIKYMTEIRIGNEIVVMYIR